MNEIQYSAFAREALKITLFCLLVTGIFKLFHASNSLLLIVFNMAVMSAASTFSAGQKQLQHVAIGSSVMVCSIVIGGVIGYYFPGTAKLLTLVYAGLAFYLPRYAYQTNIFVTGSVVFLIFTVLPFNWHDGILYALAGIGVVIIFTVFSWIFDRTYSVESPPALTPAQTHKNHRTALIVVLSLALAWIASYYLAQYTHVSHLYWIGLTALVVIQSSRGKTISTSLKRILVNTAGAVITVGLFGYLLPATFWINMAVLVLFLFLIFCLGFSYTARTLFIELFVLGFTHLLGSYHNVIAFDRVILTLIGGAIVIIVTLLQDIAERSLNRMTRL